MVPKTAPPLEDAETRWQDNTSAIVQMEMEGGASSSAELYKSGRGAAPAELHSVTFTAQLESLRCVWEFRGHSPQHCSLAALSPTDNCKFLLLNAKALYPC